MDISGPKGTFELLPGKSLFEILCDGLKKANEKYNITIPWYIMTSKENNDATVSFFEGKNYFGYPKESIKFFMQGELPMIDTNEKILLDEKWKIKQAADGNGGIFSSMINSGILSDMKEKGVKWLFIGSIDNAILKMVDSLFLGITFSQNKLAASKTVAKLNPAERVGVFCKRNGKPSVIEYSELPEEMAQKRDSNGELFFGEAHIMCNLFNIEILDRIGKEKLPYHVAFKKASYIDETGKLVEPTEPNAYKFESFIFDAFSLLDDILIMRAVRDEEFAPVKNAEGADSPETARALYLNQNK
ncbi:MAG: UTP--glucose-1-phosphate uridylyltransferase [Clostridia bacterium]|nr:UTP--glucose-1-phosphate uridylyltransferase [Clostridia bacterium]